MSFVRYRGTRRWFPLFCCLITAVVGAAETPPLRAGPMECGDIEIADIRSHLSVISQKTFDRESGLAEDSIVLSVISVWMDLEGDRIVVEVVATAKKQLLAELDLWTAFKSGFDTNLAGDLAVRMGGLAFSQPEFRQLIATVVERAASDMNGVLESATAAAANGTTKCLDQYVSASWPKSLATLYQQHVTGLEIASVLIAGDGQISVADLAYAHQAAIGGLAMIVVSEVAARLLPVLVNKLTAKAVAAMLPVGGWVVGGSLIIADVIRMKDGAVPIIERTLTNPGHLAQIHAQISERLLKELQLVSPEIALAVAEESYEAFQAFVEQWSLIITWSQYSDRFRRMVDLTDTNDLPILAELMTVLTRMSEQRDILNLIDSGELESLLHLGEGALQILEMTRDPKEAVVWGSLAGQHLNRVAATFLPTMSKPSDFRSRKELVNVLELDLDRSELLRVMALHVEERQLLFNRHPMDVKEILAITAENGDLTWLLRLLAESIEDGNAVINRILIAPDTLRKIEPGRLRAHIANNRDIEEYLDRLERDSLVDKIVHLVGGYKYNRSVPGGTPSQETLIAVMGITIFFVFVIAWTVGWRRRREGR